MTAEPQTSGKSSVGSVLESLQSCWPPGDWIDVHVAIGLSGGCDSVALLRAMLAIKQRFGGAGKVLAVHVNHQLRGEEADKDADWCRKQCESLGVPLELLQGNVGERAGAERDGIEAAARQERYELMAQTAENAGVRYLATAHTRDDQVETVLFRLLRGSGLRGLGGIPRVRSLTPSVTLIRPLLDCSRADLEAYLHAEGQTFRTDSTNVDVRFRRNRIRHELLPQLRTEFNPEVDAAIERLAIQAGEVQDYLESCARELLERAGTKRSQDSAGMNELSVATEVFRKPAEVVVREALRLVWRELGLSEQGMTYEWWKELARLVRSRDLEQPINLPGNVLASIANGRFCLQWSATDSRPGTSQGS